MSDPLYLIKLLPRRYIKFYKEGKFWYSLDRSNRVSDSKFKKDENEGVCLTQKDFGTNGVRISVGGIRLESILGVGWNNISDYYRGVKTKDIIKVGASSAILINKEFIDYYLEGVGLLKCDIVLLFIENPIPLFKYFDLIASSKNAGPLKVVDRGWITYVDEYNGREILKEHATKNSWCVLSFYKQKAQSYQQEYRFVINSSPSDDKDGCYVCMPKNIYSLCKFHVVELSSIKEYSSEYYMLELSEI